jgi:hypothetical protein
MLVILSTYCLATLGVLGELVSEKPVVPCNVNKVNNDRAGLQCTTTEAKCL